MSPKNVYVSAGVIAATAIGTGVFFWAIFSFAITGPKEVIKPTCDSKIYCQGDLLHTIQMAKVDVDSKTFVDQGLIHDVTTTLNNFETLMSSSGKQPSKRQVEEFLKANFANESELEEWTPEDFDESACFLAEIKDKDVRNFAQKIVNIWPSLGRKIKNQVAEKSEQYSIIYVPHGFIIPGGRFREYYYWDSYWIIQGLLVSNMTNTAKGMIENFFSLVQKYGHVPNGGRVYYIQRSQPPLLSHMVRRYYEETHDYEWIRSNIAVIEKEVKFWVDNRMITLKVNGKWYNAAIYNAKSFGPRPESYREDYALANENYMSESDRQQLYFELKSGAESGWDFSSRWIFDENNKKSSLLRDIKVTKLIPVDLNSFLYGSFVNVALFYLLLNNPNKAMYWSQKASEINQTINEVLWNAEDKIWYDYDTELEEQRKYYAASNLTPLWTKAYNTERDATQLIVDVIAYLKKNNVMDYEGGIPTTKDDFGEQWDFPNAWPPLQAIIVNGLDESGVPEGQELAKEFATKWIHANMVGFNTGKAMGEKYHVTNVGKYGGGGEYNVQTGFGWTNGIALEFIKRFFTN